MQALDICPVLEALSYVLPTFVVELLDCNLQECILLRRPVTLVGTVLVLGGASLVQGWVLSLSATDDVRSILECVLVSWCLDMLDHGLAVDGLHRRVDSTITKVREVAYVTEILVIGILRVVIHLLLLVIILLSVSLRAALRQEDLIAIVLIAVLVILRPTLV